MCISIRYHVLQASLALLIQNTGKYLQVANNKNALLRAPTPTEWMKLSYATQGKQAIPCDVISTPYLVSFRVSPSLICYCLLLYTQPPSSITLHVM